MMQATLLRLSATWLVVAPACDQVEDSPGNNQSILHNAAQGTQDPNGNGILDRGEITKPEPDFENKNICSQGIEIRWEACLFERDQFDQMKVSKDINEREVCGVFNTMLNCIDYKLYQGNTSCIGGDYCEFLITGTAFPDMVCGWRFTELEARNAVTGERLENFDRNSVEVEELDFELLPIAVGP